MKQEPIKWRGHDLSSDAAIMFYRGRVYVRPIGRGVVLEELELRPQLDEVLDSGFYEVEISVRGRVDVEGGAE